MPIAGELNLPVAIRYIFPHAPQRPVTINGGFVMRAWYDITRAAPISTAQSQDEEGIYDSQAAVEALIAQEVASGIAPANIFLAGFSQGGAIALHTALRQTVPLGGVLVLSAYLLLAESAPDEAAGSPAKRRFSWRMDATTRSCLYALGAAQARRCWNSAMRWNGMNTRCSIRYARRSCGISRLG